MFGENGCRCRRIQAGQEGFVFVLIGIPRPRIGFFRHNQQSLPSLTRKTRQIGIESERTAVGHMPNIRIDRDLEPI